MTAAQVDEAMEIVRLACEEAGLRPEMSVRPYFDPEECGPGMMMVEARFQEDIDRELLFDLLATVGQRLADAHLLEPETAITYDLVGPW